MCESSGWKLKPCVGNGKIFLPAKLDETFSPLVSLTHTVFPYNVLSPMFANFGIEVTHDDGKLVLLGMF